MASEPQTSNLGDRLVSAGLVSSDDLARACTTALNAGAAAIGTRLVLLGVLQDEDLADFVAGESETPRATIDELAGCIEVFDVLPFEVIYDSAVIPIRFDEDNRLVVGVLDPSESAALEEAQFFAGLELALRVLSLSQFATEFERVSRVPWSVPAEELRSLRRPIGESRHELDHDLRKLFASVTTSSSHSLSVESSDGEAPAVEVVRREWAAAESGLGPSDIRVEAVSDDEPLSDIVELTPVASRDSSVSARIEVSSSQLEVVEELTGTPVPTVEISVSVSGNLEAILASEVEVEPVKDMEDIEDDEEIIDLVQGSASKAVSELVDERARRAAPTPDVEAVPVRSNTDQQVAIEPAVTETIRMLEPESQVDLHRLLDDQKGDGRRRDGHPTPARSLESAVSRGGNRGEQRTPATSVSAVLASETSQPSMRLTEASASGLGRPVRLQMATTGMQATVVSRSPEGSRRASQLTPRPIPTVGEYLGSDLSGSFGTLSEAIDTLGPAAPATTAAIQLTLAGLDEADARDEVARELVETLSLVYPTVLVLRLKLPRLVVWEGVLSTGGAQPNGFAFEVQEGSVWQRVAGEGLVFAGTLPTDGPLRRELPRALGTGTLVVPLQMGGRIVGVLVLDGGVTGRLEPPGTELRTLCDGFEVALRRVIMKRKTEGRPV